jgi:hypothetical protein
MDMINASEPNPALPFLTQMAIEIAAIETMAASTPDWTTARNLGKLAEGCRELLDFFTQLPGLMDGAEPWRPSTSTSSR